MDFRQMDLRKKQNSLIHGSKTPLIKSAGKRDVLAALKFMGEDEGMAEEILGYLSLHGMQINPNNIDDYLKMKKSSKFDMRKK